MASSDAGAQTSVMTQASIAPFLDPEFSPVSFLNSTLPEWTLPATAKTASSTLADLSAQAQVLVAQLDARLARLSATLTQLTDDILRSGGRLSYEVEILKGDAASLNDALAMSVNGELAKLVKGLSPLNARGELDAHLIPQPTAVGTERRHMSISAAARDNEQSSHSPVQSRRGTATNAAPQLLPLPPPPASMKPEHITHLRRLYLVRTRLEAVITTFENAMSWPVSPSTLAAPNGFTPTTTTTSQDAEIAGREFEQRTRDEVTDLLDADELEAAKARVQELRALCAVWKGTIEERARARFVEAMEKQINEKEHGLDE